MSESMRGQEEGNREQEPGIRNRNQDQEAGRTPPRRPYWFLPGSWFLFSRLRNLRSSLAFKKQQSVLLPRIRGSSIMSDQTYDDDRARNLEDLLRALAARIRELDESGDLLRHASELTRLIGDVRSELFHYEVRATYDTPDVAENRRIVDEATRPSESKWESNEWTPDQDDEPKW